MSSYSCELFSAVFVFVICNRGLMTILLELREKTCRLGLPMREEDDPVAMAPPLGLTGRGEIVDAIDIGEM